MQAGFPKKEGGSSWLPSCRCWQRLEGWQKAPRRLEMLVFERAQRPPRRHLQVCVARIISWAGCWLQGPHERDPASLAEGHSCLGVLPLVLPTCMMCISFCRLL